jgi:hypothetical protein
MVTSRELQTRAVVRVCNMRGTAAEHWIKASKLVANSSRLPCHRFRGMKCVCAAAAERGAKQESQRIEPQRPSRAGGVSAGRPGGVENLNYAESFSLSGACSGGMRKDCPSERPIA